MIVITGTPISNIGKILCQQPFVKRDLGHLGPPHNGACSASEVIIEPNQVPNETIDNDSIAGC